jgi:hypothetical protein
MDSSRRSQFKYACQREVRKGKHMSTGYKPHRAFLSSPMLLEVAAEREGMQHLRSKKGNQRTTKKDVKRLTAPYSPSRSLIVSVKLA